MSIKLTDIVPGIDPTSLPQITGSQLYALVNNAQLQADRGMIIATTDVAGVPVVPDAGTYSRWQTYFWLRFQPNSTSFSIYAWNPLHPNGNPQLLYWNSITSGTIPAGSIIGSMLADSTITKEKIENIDISQINGSNTLLTSTSTFTGDVTGTQGTSLAIGANKVTGAMVQSSATVDADRAISTNHVKDLSITAGKLAADSVTESKILSSAVTNSKLGPGAVTDGKIALLSLLTTKLSPAAVVGDNNKLIAVLDAAAGTVKYIDATALRTYLKTAGYYVSPAPFAVANTSESHALGAVPPFVRVVFVQTDAASRNGYSQNDELEVSSVVGPDYRPYFQISSDATKVYISVNSTASTIYMIPKGGGTILTDVTAMVAAGYFKLKIYASL